MHISTLEIRFKEADAIYLLDIATDTCLESVRQRESQDRTDFPKYLDKQIGDFDAFTQGVLEFEEKRKPRIIELHNKYPNKDFIVFHSKEEIYRYLKDISAKYEN